MSKVFGLLTDAGKVTMPAEDEKEAEEKTRKALPNLKEIKEIWEMSEAEIAESKIFELQQQVAIMGANDYEIPTINNILTELRAGNIEPKVAVEQVQRIKNRKQDYH